MLKIIVNSLRNYFTNPGKYYNDCDSDDTTFIGGVNILSFICFVIGLVVGLEHISSYGVALIVCNILAFGLIITYAIVSDRVRGENITSINDPYAVFAIISTLLASLLTGSFIVLSVVVITVELMAVIVYHIPMAVIRHFVRPAKNKKEAYDKFMSYKA